MSLIKYSAFVTVARTKSFTKTAEIMMCTQSGVSHLINSLEEELGLKLFVRQKNGVLLTTEGEKILEVATEVLNKEQDLQTVVRRIHGLEVGKVSIGTFSSATISLLPTILQTFEQKYPGIEVQVINDTYSVIEDALLENKVDLAFITLPSKNKYKTIHLMQDRLMAVLPENHKCTFCETVQVSQLLSEPFIVPAEGTDYDIGKVFSSAKGNIFPNVKFRMGDDFAALALVKQGLGYTIFPELLVKSLPMDNVKAIPLEGSEREIGLAYSETRGLSPATETFLNHVVNTLTLDKNT
ncbi:MAG: LysR family transcriptional regulator [Sphaerochaetaceae bacterium]|nr:LysR family transcriptional regulator [Sphaerochaetaceae bacterium]